MTLQALCFERKTKQKLIDGSRFGLDLILSLPKMSFCVSVILAACIWIKSHYLKNNNI